MPDKILEHLQKAEAGLLCELTPELAKPINKRTYQYKRWREKGIPVKEDNCPVCGVDIVIGHHIKVYKRQRKYNGDEEAGFIRIIGYIWICPNCHYRIHSRNPYFKNGRR